MTKKAKKNRHSKKIKVSKVPAETLDRGFDLGLQMRVMAVPDIEFNQALREADVIGCAYGYHPVEGMSRPVPSITLIGTNSSAFVRAYQHFVRWGCEEDGDVVSVDLLLRSDGSYDMWIGPEIERSLYRTIPQAGLFDVMAMHMSWIKHLDSTNDMVRELKLYCESGLRPVVISAAIGDPKNRTSLQIKPVPEWKGILKFQLSIVDQAETTLDPRFALASKRPTSKKEGLKSLPTPETLSQRRVKTLDTVFPVSRERVRRSSLVDRVRGLAGFENVTETQVTQAAINLMISGKLVAGDIHYRQITGDVYKKIWEAIASRVETADGTRQPADQDPLVVAHQIELDVRTILKKMKSQDLHNTFPRLQKVFRREGYVND